MFSLKNTNLKAQLFLAPKTLAATAVKNKYSESVVNETINNIYFHVYVLMCVGIFVSINVCVCYDWQARKRRIKEFCRLVIPFSRF